MRIVLLGPNGQLGWELRRALAPLGEVIALDRNGLDGHPQHGHDSSGSDNRLSGDLREAVRIASMLRDLKPDVVVNAAAYTAVDRAEAEPDRAHAVNAVAPGVIARELALRSAWLVHFSSDYVFDGSGQLPRDELAATGPLNVYGRSKLAGEEAIRTSGCPHLILRTSWVHAARGGNFARSMLKLATQRDTLQVVNDQIGAPTGADLLADVTVHALRAAMANRRLAGTYHACAAGEVSWCDYARHVIAWGQRAGLSLRAGPECVEGIPSSAYASAALRPLNSRLDTAKLRQAFGLTLPTWQQGVERMLTEVLPSLAAATTLGIGATTT